MVRLVFIQKDVFAKPGIMALSASVKRAGHTCELVIVDLEVDPVAAALSSDPDVIAFSITTGEYPFMKKIGRLIRDRFKGRIICGGAHSTFYPDVINDDYLDAICRGEGDEALSDYLDALDRNEDGSDVLNMSVKCHGKIKENHLRPLINDLDSLPYFDRDLYATYPLYRENGHEILYHQVVIAGRGCPYTCSFCFNKSYNDLYRGKGAPVRRRSVENIIREVKGLVSQGKTRFLTFDDDSFTLAPRVWLDEFCETYGQEIGLPFKINSTAGALSEHRVKTLKKAGCYAVKVGLESGNECLRTRLLNKKVSDQSLIRAANLLKKYRIRYQTFNMVGLPGETLDQALETYHLNRVIQPDFAWCSLLNPYPGTDIYRYCVRQGYLNEHGFVETGYSYFTGSKLTIPEPVKRLQTIMFVALVFRLSPEMVRKLVTIPLTRLYRFLFGIGMFWGLMRMNKISFLKTLKLSWRYLIRYNHED